MSWDKVFPVTTFFPDLVRRPDIHQSPWKLRNVTELPVPLILSLASWTLPVKKYSRDRSPSLPAFSTTTSPPSILYLRPFPQWGLCLIGKKAVVGQMDHSVVLRSQNGGSRVTYYISFQLPQYQVSTERSPRWPMWQFILLCHSVVANLLFLLKSLLNIFLH